MRDLTALEISKFSQFIPQLLNKHKMEIQSKNKIKDHEEATEFNSFQLINNVSLNKKIFPYANYENRVEKLQQIMAEMSDSSPDNKFYNKLQHDSLMTIFQSLSTESTDSSSSSRLKMFLTGEGGTGKSKVIEYAVEFGRLYFGRQHGIYGPVLAIAQTGTAANNIDGYTWHSVLNKGVGKHQKITDDSARKVGLKIKGVELLIIDEVSLVSLQDLYEISERFIAAKLTTVPSDNIQLRNLISSQPFGGIHVLLVGDLYQLPCVAGTPVYTPLNKLSTNPSRSNTIKGYEIWNSITSFVELIQNMRMQSADENGKKFIAANSDLRKGIVTDEHLLFLNTRIQTGKQTALINAGPKAVWIANTNRIVDSMNSKQFKRLSQQNNFSVRIIAQHKPLNLANLPDEEVSKKLFEYTKNKTTTKVTATYIDLCIGSRVMLTRNLGTEINLVNGSIGTVKGFGFSKDDSTLQNCANGQLPRPSTFHQIKPPTSSPVVFVEFPLMKVKGRSFDNNDVIRKTVPITMESSRETFKVDNINYYRWQLPLTPAAAITTHKSQGITAKDGVVYKPSAHKPHTRGLEYVAISRCPDISKLFLLKPLRKEHFNKYEGEIKLINECYARLRTI